MDRDDDRFDRPDDEPGEDRFGRPDPDLEPEEEARFAHEDDTDAGPPRRDLDHRTASRTTAQAAVSAIQSLTSQSRRSAGIAWTISMKAPNRDKPTSKRSSGARA